MVFTRFGGFHKLLTSSGLFCLRLPEFCKQRFLSFTHIRRVNTPFFAKFFPIQANIEEGFQPQPVARQSAIGTQPRSLGAVAVPGAPAAVGLKQAQGQFSTDELLEIEIG